MARRSRPEIGDGRADFGRDDALADVLGEEVERLDRERDDLREQLAEVEGWYRLLRADHDAMKAEADRCGRRSAELQADRDRLERENRKLDALVARLGEPGARTGAATEESNTMSRIRTFVQAARRNKWVAAALVALGALLARDPAVGRAIEAATDRAKQALERRGEPNDSGFVLYAAMLHARDQAERARDQYNRIEATLKGDALLEAQDRLRAAKARDLRARLAFFPELARRCERASVPLPREAADALAALKSESRD